MMNTQLMVRTKVQDQYPNQDQSIKTKTCTMSFGSQDHGLVWSVHRV